MISIVGLRLLFAMPHVSELKTGPIPDSLNGYSLFQYGTDAHSGMTRKAIRSGNITVFSYINHRLSITHMICEGVLQCIIR